MCRNDHLSITYFYLLLWELLCYYKSCYSNPDWAGRVHTALLQPVCGRWGKSAIFGSHTVLTFFFFFLIYKEVIQNASFIHNTLKMWIKLNFIASEANILFVQNSCMTLLYFDSKVTVSWEFCNHHHPWSMSLAFILIQKKYFSVCGEIEGKHSHDPPKNAEYKLECSCQVFYLVFNRAPGEFSKKNMQMKN